MKATSLKNLAAAIAAGVLMLGLATSGRASVVIEQMGPIEIGSSWLVPFGAFGGTFDTVTGTVSSPVFEIPGLTASGWATGADTPSFASISDSPTIFLDFVAHFTNLPGTTPPFLLDFTEYNGGLLVGETLLEWTGTEFDVVPETSTIFAGVLLLLPFGASTLRALRKSRMA